MSAWADIDERRPDKGVKVQEFREFRELLRSEVTDRFDGSKESLKTDTIFDRKP